MGDVGETGTLFKGDPALLKVTTQYTRNRRAREGMGPARVFPLQGA